MKRNNSHAQKKEYDNQAQRIKSQIKCYRCNRYGHIARECRSNIDKKSKQSAKQLDDRVEDTDSDQESRDNSTFMLSTTEEVMLSQRNNPVWCIDSGCTGHMCNEKSLYEQGLTMMDSELNLANDQSTQIKGMGKISISVDTGSEERQINITKAF